MTARVLAVLIGIVALLVAADAAFAQAGSLPVSKGRYRVPYQNGTTVGANNDHTTHPSSLNRIDMGGRGGGPYNIAAAARAGCWNHRKYKRARIHTQPKEKGPA